MQHLPEIALLIMLGSFILILLAGMTFLYRHDHQCRRDLVRRTKTLRIHSMLEHAGIPLARYLRKARPLTVEKHLMVCTQCATIDLCDKCLKEGRDIPEDSFCRNYHELIRYR